MTRYQVHVAKQWCERRAADIEALTKREGHLPHDIPEIEEDSPEVNGHPTEFWSLADDFGFTIEVDTTTSWRWRRSMPTWTFSDL